MFAKPPFGFHRGEITLTTSRLKKGKRSKGTANYRHKNSTSAICMPRKFDVVLFETLSSKTRRAMARDFSERRIG